MVPFLIGADGVVISDEMFRNAFPTRFCRGIQDEPIRSEKSPPWQRRGGRAIKKYSRSFKRRGRVGSFNLRIDSNGSLNEPPRLRPAKVASRHFIDGRSHPSFAKLRQGGEFQLILFSSFAANCLARSGSLTFLFNIRPAPSTHERAGYSPDPSTKRQDFTAR